MTGTEKMLDRIAICLSALITNPREDQLSIEEIHNVNEICKKIVIALPEEDLQTLFCVDPELMTKTAEDFEKISKIFE